MCGGRDSPPSAPSLQSAPHIEDFRGFIDYIFGAEMKMEKDPVTGKQIPVVRRLKRTSERQMMFDNGVKLFKEGLKNIEFLNQHYPQALPNYLPVMNVIGDLNRERKADMAQIVGMPNFDEYVQNFTQMQERAIDEEYRVQADALHERYNRLGYGDSTALNEALATLSAKKANAMVEMRGKSPAYAAGLQKAYLENTSGHMRLKEGMREGISGAEGQLLGFEKEQITGERQLADANLARNEGMYNKAGQLIAYDDNLMKGNFAAEGAFKDKQFNNEFNLRRNAQENDRRMKQYQMDMLEFQNQKPDTGDMLLQGGMNLIGRGIGAGFGGAGFGW
jgi:hypothetical protein